MRVQEEKILQCLKLTFLFLITMLVLTMFGDLFTLILLVFYIAFVKG